MNKFIKVFGLVFVVVVFGVVIYYSRQIPDQNIPGGSMASGQNDAKRIASPAIKTFTHPDYGFSFDYPADFTVGNFSEDESKTITVQSGEGEDSFQIIVSPYEEKVPLSFESIRKAAEGLKVSNEKEIQIGQGKIKAFSFTLEEAAEEGGTNEIWFVEAENLYQITNYSDFSNEIPQILDSLRFN